MIAPSRCPPPRRATMAAHALALPLLCGVAMGCPPRGPQPPIDCDAGFAYDAVSVSGSAKVAKFSASFETSQEAVREVDAMVERYAAQWSALCREYNAGAVDKPQYQQRSQELTDRMDRIQTLAVALEQAPDAQSFQEVLRQLHAAAVPEQAVDLSVALSVLALRPGSARFEVLPPDASIPTGTKLRFSIEPSTAAHVYLYQVSSEGQVNPLFPDARIPATNPLPAGTVLEIPPAPASFRLDDSDIGLEEVHLVASITPMPALLADLAHGGGNDGGAQANRLDCSARGLEYDAGRDCPKARGIVRTSSDTTHSITAVNAAADDAVHLVFRFQHVAQ